MTVESWGEYERRRRLIRIAQAAAITCHGNAILRGLSSPKFFPYNSTCEFCGSISFWDVLRCDLPGDVYEYVSPCEIANTPDSWFSQLSSRNIRCLRLNCLPTKHIETTGQPLCPSHEDHIWQIEAELHNGDSEIWIPRWDIFDTKISQKEGKNWFVRYNLSNLYSTRQTPKKPLTEIKKIFFEALLNVRTFAEVNGLGFTDHFTAALKILDHFDFEPANHADISPPGVLDADALQLLNAATRAWVFGGNGCWNALRCDESMRQEYQEVTYALYDAIHEAVAAAATASAGNAKAEMTEPCRTGVLAMKAANEKNIQDYLKKFSNGNPALHGILAQILTPVLSGWAPCLRAVPGSIDGRGPLYEFAPLQEISLAGRIHRITTLLEEAMTADSSWLRTNTNLTVLAQAENPDVVILMLKEFNCGHMPVGARSYDIEIVKQFADGFSIIHLQTAAAINRQFTLMKQNFGNYTPERLAQNLWDEWRLYSLWDPQDKPQASMLVKLKGKKTVQLCRGYGNRPLNSRYLFYIREFMEENGIEVNRNAL